MITGLFEEIKKVFTGDELEEEKQEGRGLESPMKGDDVGVGGEGLMYRSLQGKTVQQPSRNRIYAGHIPQTTGL